MAGSDSTFSPVKQSSCFTSLMRFRVSNTLVFRFGNIHLASVHCMCATECAHVSLCSPACSDLCVNIHGLCFTNRIQKCYNVRTKQNTNHTMHRKKGMLSYILLLQFLNSPLLPYLSSLIYFLSLSYHALILLSLLLSHSGGETVVATGEAETHFSV